MNKILPLFFIFCASLHCLAIQDKDININAGLGVFGSRGILGVSADRFITPHHAISVAFGADFVGATSLVGYKYFSEKTNDSNSNWGKCFFVFECDSHAYIGPSLQYAGATTLKITEGANEREYRLDPKWLGLISFGFRSIFKNNVTLDTELSYRSILSGGHAEQTLGTNDDDRKSIEMGYRTVGINVGLGYIF